MRVIKSKENKMPTFYPKQKTSLVHKNRIIRKGRVRPTDDSVEASRRQWCAGECFITDFCEKKTNSDL